MTRLLVSVRCAAEAEAALRGGASLIDVKEPANGALGRADDSVLADVVRTVAGRRPISAALGELDDFNDKLPQLPLAYVKWGLAGFRGREYAWRSELFLVMQRLREQQPNCRAVAVAYADWQRAGAPTQDEVAAFAVEQMAGAFLVDTWQKDGTTLLDWASLEMIERWIERCRAARVPIALAGSLGPKEIQTLLPLQPDWFAVRGAVCQGRQRNAAIDEGKVRQLVSLL